jgi:hypothetical protein
MVSVNITVSEESVRKAAMKVLEACAIELKGRSQALCPVDSGTLRGSAVVDVQGNTVTVGYGGAASAYALVQHENLHFHHPVGQDKFLEQPFDEMVPEIIKRVKEVKI